MAELSGAYSRAFDQHGTNAYWRVLKGLEPDRMRAAFQKAIASEGFCPSPAVIMAHARSLPKRREEAAKEKPYTPPTAEQWKEIRGLMAKLGEHLGGEDAADELSDRRRMRARG
jgi:hypothetical protein